MTPFPQLGATISERIVRLRQNLPAGMRLIAVTKQVSVAAMREAYAAGVRDFGESRIQEAEAKQSQLQDLTDVTWHLIGHLQGNKAQKALERFDWIHSVDSLKLAQKLDRLAAESHHKTQTLLQVKMLPDPSKFGWSVADLLADLASLNECRDLKIRGLMVIPPLALDDDQITSVFQQAQQLANQIQQQNWSNIQMDQLSMGMSDDFMLAVQSGSTMIRLGRILFGDRTD